MNKQVIRNESIGVEYLKIDHPSGLSILLCPMQGYSQAYALFGTNYGSIDNCFKTNLDNDFIEIPDGVAHFLEHKMFENEEGDAFALYAETGASANAFTSFDRTCYLFSCTDKFEESLRILLDFVSRPYFTKETVQKEQGIIGQEIRMYEDDPDWRVMFNLLGALYHEHPVRKDIAGTVESIAEIDAELLYRCHRTFYNLNNMVLAIAGNFEVDTVLRLCDEMLKTGEDIRIEKKAVDEPADIVRKKCEQKLAVSIPLFCIGFKEKPAQEGETVKTKVLADILLDVLAGESSPLYRALYDKGLINAQFTTEAFLGRGYFTNMFEGESKDPDAVFGAIVEQAARYQREGLPRDAFERAKKSMYGRAVAQFNNVESVALSLVSSQFQNTGLFDVVEAAANVTFEEAQAFFKEHFDGARCALSVVLPA